jgi:pyruvate/2-oxoglutarate dehydrogenase complex dihydrolipoamide acyltransferase (E2) component
MTQVIVPRLGVSVTKIRIIEWLVDDGATVAEQEPILIFATDKVQHELPAAAGGTIRLLAEIDEECPVGAVIAEIG